MKHLFFDMDGTITDSRQIISDEMITKLSSLKNTILVISGASKKQMLKQLKGLKCSILAQSGNDNPLWTRKLNTQEKLEIHKHITLIKEQFPFYFKTKQYKKLVEDRGCQISLSLLGHQANPKLKANFDISKKKRKTVLEKIPFESETLCCTIAGTTCFDYTFKNGKKGDNIANYIKQKGWNKNDCIYYGDALFKGGNDESVIGVIETVAVLNPKNLLLLL